MAREMKTISGPTNNYTTTGNIYYVHNSEGSNGNHGQSALKPVADIDYAIGLCSANQGDIIVVMPGHAQTLTATITCDVAGIAIVGMGNGTNRPTLTQNLAADGIELGAANVTWDNFYFPASVTATAVARFNMNEQNCIVRNCLFLCGTKDAETITWTAAGDESMVENCEFRITANAPTAAIEVEAAVSGVRIVGCIFRDGGGTNKWDTGAINSGAINPGMLIRRCSLISDEINAAANFLTLTTSTTGNIEQCYIGSDGSTIGTACNPGSMTGHRSSIVTDLDESGSEMPATTST